MESAALSARGSEARPTPQAIALVREIFASISQLEDVLQRGHMNAMELSDPISRIDNGGPVYPPSKGSADADNDADNVVSQIEREPSLIEQLQIIRDRIDEQRVQADMNADITREAHNRLCGAV